MTEKRVITAMPIGLRVGGDLPTPWPELFALHVEEVDIITGTVTILQFEHECGGILEVNDTDEGFEQMLTDLPNYLPVPQGIRDKITGLPGGTPMTLWRKDKPLLN